MFGWFKKKPAEPEPLSGDPPISHDDLRALFEYLDRPNPSPCDHTHKECVEFLRGRQLPVGKTLGWLKANGGHCDCEVIFNVTDEWGEKVGWNPKTEE
ncbi:MAG: DUF2695 domain-containing protein [Planctomycetes bacterium]|nr:DUF2695 domain-containing protein [Planctomycetota bacterium]